MPFCNLFIRRPFVLTDAGLLLPATAVLMLA